MDMPAGFYGIADESFGCVEAAHKLVEFGAKVIQYRRKTGSDRERYEEARLIRRIVSDRAVYIVNDRLDIALAVGADGVHVGHDDLPPHVIRGMVPEGFVIGCTVHSVGELDGLCGCDYIAVGPLFETNTKVDALPPRTIDEVAEVVKRSTVPVYLIGGISIDNISAIKGLGARGFVSVSDVLRHDINHFRKMVRIWGD